MDSINEKPAIDGKDLVILERLRSSDHPQSGERIAQTLGISRVALWKRIEALKSVGYAISSEKRGYLLTGDDAVVSEEFADPRDVVYSPDMPSTMDEAWKRAEAGAVSGTLVLADRQSAGRGQHGRPWASPAGGLYMTLVLRSSLPLAYAGAFVLESARALKQIAYDRMGAELEYHWPNDLMLRGRKVGGILVEASGSPDRVRFFTLGIGLNIQPVEIADRETAGIGEFGASRPKRREIAAALRDRMRDWSAEPVLRPEDWYRGFRGDGRLVHGSHWDGKGFAGRVTGFTRQGGLILDTETLSMGETRIVRFEGEKG